jgi:hypothetical protein
MPQDEIDRILSKEPEIAPSPLFVSTVMRAIRQEAAVPPPIAFPWKRLLPLLGTAFAVGAVLTSRLHPSEEAAPILPSNWLSAFSLVSEIWKSSRVNWIVFALLLSLASIRFCSFLFEAKHVPD